ncbi:hypothetical protein AVEN_189055-1 [Araneus ventricosus]|uniref:Uncharacterized protein n=1 Tax=Araneus ventricosus TaxID=182803 RepID=A0A4Y2JJJ0_ARAVE|nr:hypothetical protein AVEN_189055-1 [Araneus ventricosus]
MSIKKLCNSTYSLTVKELVFVASGRLHHSLKRAQNDIDPDWETVNERDHSGGEEVDRPLKTKFFSTALINKIKFTQCLLDARDLFRLKQKER